MIIDLNAECAICSELQCSRGSRISTALDDESILNAVSILSDQFAIIPSVGPLVLGHALAVTRRHSNNVLATPNHTAADELAGVCHDYLSQMANRIPDVQMLCFEHGCRYASSKSLCSTDHGHLHLLPLSQNEISKILYNINGQRFRLGKFQEIAGVLGPFQEYVTAFVVTANSQEIGGVVLDASNVPSQYLRRVVADQLGLSGWDWKSDSNAALLRRTVALGFQPNTQATIGEAVPDAVANVSV